MNRFSQFASSLQVSSPYQVGGSLSPEKPCYVYRQADEEIYNGLLAGEFCYVLNSRQMGKSSLMVQTLKRLEMAGHRCATLDITSLGAHQVTAPQWYRGAVADLWRGFGLFQQFDYKTWWREQEALPPVQKLHYFLQEALLEPYPEDTFVIFIDEIDSILGVEFSLDDFFALIRFCYNQRAVDLRYRRLTFAIFGVATPADLIQDRQRTPFNIGQAIALQGFQMEECAPLLTGLERAIAPAPTILREVLAWTGGQPFLTQKLCACIWQKYVQQGTPISMPADEAAAWVRQLVYDRIIHQWESQDEPEHLRTIRDRLLRHPHRTGRLLGIYQQILRVGQVPLDPSPEATELLLSGLVVKEDGQLRVKNRIYQEVFNDLWLAHHLHNLRPYSQALQAWAASGQTDRSRLLRGQALKDAQLWSQGKRLSDEDYQFLAASVECDRQEMQQALALERGRAATVQLQQSQRVAQLQRWLLGTMGLGCAIATGLGVFAWYESVRASRNEQLARVSEIRALTASAQGWFASNNRLDALLQAMRAQNQLAHVHGENPDLQHDVDAVTRKIILGINEVNRFIGHTDEVTGVAFSPHGDQIASVSKDNTVKLWRLDGTLYDSLEDHHQEVTTVSYSPDGKWLASGCTSGAIKLWDARTGELLRTLQQGEARILTVAFSPDGETLAGGDIEGNIQVWERDGRLLRQFKAHEAMVRSVAFSPDGALLVSGSADRTLKFWQPTEGNLLKTLTGHTSTVAQVTFSPDGQQIASASSDKTIKLWNREGSLLNTLEGHQAAVTAVQFLADGQRLVSTSLDHEVRFWQRNGEPLPAYQGITAAGRAITVSPDGEFLVSSGRAENHEVILWRLASPFYEVVGSHNAAVVGVVHSPTQDILASSGVGGDIKLWHTDGTAIATIAAHRAPAVEVVFSPDGQTLLSSGMDGNLQLWNADGTPQFTYAGHQPDLGRGVFAPDGQTVASAGTLSPLRIWQRDGRETLLPKSVKGISSVAWHPQRSLIAYSDADYHIQFWDPETNTPQPTLVGHTANIRDLDFDETGDRLASASEDRTIRLWNVRTGQAITTLTGHTDVIWDVTFAPLTTTAIVGQPLLASASADKTIRLWNAASGELVAVLDKHEAAVYRLTFSPDGRWMFSASADKTVIRWDLAAIMALNPVSYACNWTQNYRVHNPERADEVRELCEY